MANPKTMTKKVNINAKIPVRTIVPPIYGIMNGVSMSPANIFKCLNHRAIIDEVLSDGSTVRLTMKNYNTDNSWMVKKADETSFDELADSSFIPEEEAPTEGVEETSGDDSGESLDTVDEEPVVVINGSEVEPVTDVIVEESTVGDEAVPEEMLVDPVELPVDEVVTAEGEEAEEPCSIDDVIVEESTPVKTTEVAEDVKPQFNQQARNNYNNNRNKRKNRR